MSLIASLTKKSKLKATIEQTAKARKSEGNTADGLFKAAYQGYAEVLLDDPVRADALLQLGFCFIAPGKNKNL